MNETDPIGAAIRDAVQDVHASPQLRARLAGATAPARSVRPARRRLPVLAGAAGALAACAVVAALVLPGGGPGAPSVAQASAAALLAPSLPAPHDLGAGTSLLDARIGGVSFPDWEQAFGWTATGARRDRLGDRDALTVFYGDGRDRRLGYAIVAGAPLDVSASARRVTRNGVRVAITRGAGGATVVTWKRGGHSCVLAAKGVATDELVRLATWRANGALPY